MTRDSSRMLRNRRGLLHKLTPHDNKKDVLLTWANWPYVKIAKKWIICAYTIATGQGRGECLETKTKTIGKVLNHEGFQCLGY